ncbi:uncharacterized protein K02A2.6-like [Toxorhynchites rutilus septentrionalis]|uniref:uncharacterized protein K02A2.6-like n=1 Tax=Toxorhynchites rutilus septentrionalis TaxID=329112 RepID=UPI00247891FA|nr:uncharacterized protein K02A2.6-like [Toxorhynchites rutilus septentrionalis]
MIIPKNLRKRFLTLAHEGHPGESAMKRRLRERVWWPGMDREITKWVAGCEGCRLVGLPQKPEPLRRRPLPSEAWTDVAIDFLGPLASGVYLFVIIDYFSKYKEVEIMTRITARETVERLNKIFRRLGFPRTITLDNAKQFVSLEFSEYCKQNGIFLNYSISYWPQQNGEVERQNRSLLKRLQISCALKRDWRQDLDDYLMMYYSTPHSATGKTPTELLTGRTIRTKIPSLKDIESAPTSEAFRDRDLIQKHQSIDRENSNRHTREFLIGIGDRVLMQNLNPENKLSTTYVPTEFTVLDKEGSRVTVQNDETGRVFQRNSAHLKRITHPQEIEPGLEPRLSFIPQVRQPNDPPGDSSDAGDKFDSNSRPRRSIRRPLRLDDYV